MTAAPAFPPGWRVRWGSTAPAEPFRIDWRNGPEPGTPPFPVYPAELVHLLPPDWLAGKVVLVGTVLSGTDLHRTPLSPSGASMPGVEIQAHVLAQLLDGRVSRRLGMPRTGASHAGRQRRGRRSGGGGIAALAAGAGGIGHSRRLWSGSAALFAGGGALVPLLSPTLALAGGFAGMTAHRSLRERADRRTLMALFANHVSEPVADEIWRERATFMAGGRPKPQQLTAAVLFSDIKGFTTICEALPPDALIRWLDTYLDMMVDIVSAHDGVVLRFIGDAVLAVFGAPVARTSQAEIDADAARAVDCALAMGRALEALNRRWEAEDLPPIMIRIGIHTGPLVAGSLGGARHREYSLLGDTANTAARLEAYAKEVGERTTRLESDHRRRADMERGQRPPSGNPGGRVDAQGQAQPGARLAGARRRSAQRANQRTITVIFFDMTGGSCGTWSASPISSWMVWRPGGSSTKVSVWPAPRWMCFLSLGIGSSSGGRSVSISRW